jgi:hypothetical protein
MINEEGGYSSVGRAPALQAGCQRFKSAYLHQREKKKKKIKFSTVITAKRGRVVRMLKFKTSEKNLENCIISRNSKRTGNSKERKVKFTSDRAKLKN